MTDRQGVIESLPYEDDVSFYCQWIIQATEGNAVNVTFSHLSLTSTSCLLGYVEVKTEGTAIQRRVFSS